MKKILVIGAGAMGTSFAMNCLDTRSYVTLVEPYSVNFIEYLKKNKKHPGLGLKIPKKIKLSSFSANILNKKWDLVVIALSSSGINFIGKILKDCKANNKILILTKGLIYEKDLKKIITLSEKLKSFKKDLNVSVLKGPCLAKDLANKVNSRVIVANKNLNIAKIISKMITTRYYNVEVSNDVRGVEICSSIKNIYSMVIGAGKGFNMSSYLFVKCLNEMTYLTKYFKGNAETVYGLAGLGDLYVSALGGRNSKMGYYLGKGYNFKVAKEKFMKNDTIEGEILLREIAPYVKKKLNKKKLPLMMKLIKSIISNNKLLLN
tara:strand:- start:6 stop:962 length:957 start_codon:yes stop_codon:yes gene_type:complete